MVVKIIAPKADEATNCGFARCGACVGELPVGMISAAESAESN